MKAKLLAFIMKVLYASITAFMVMADAARYGWARLASALYGLVRCGWARNGLAWVLPKGQTMNAITEVSNFSNGAAALIGAAQPYRVNLTLTGTADLLMHRWNNEAVDEKAAAAKNSKAKKTDDIESYVYRDDEGMICLPGEYVRQSIIFAAKFRQDPRSPRKSAMDLYKAGVVSLTHLASLGTEKWDYEDRRRVVIQRSGVNRTRPAMKKGWRAEFEFMVLTPEYIEPTDLHGVLTQAGILIGVADFRPTYGRFAVTRFDLATN